MCDLFDVCGDSEPSCIGKQPSRCYNPMCDDDVGEEDIYPECFKPWPKPENDEASGSTEAVG